MKYSFKIAGAALLSIALTASASFANLTINQPSIDKNATWSGNVSVLQPVKVSKDVTVTVQPGTVVKFKDGAGLIVEGVLKASGKKSAPITFTSEDKTPAPGCWTGINFSESGDGSILKKCIISYASSISIASCSPPIQDCEIVNGEQGIVLARKSKPVISGNTIHNLSGSGINCQMGAYPSITGNTVDKCKLYGIVSSQDSMPLIKNNTVTGCDTGLFIQGAQPMEGNLVKGNKIGLMLSSAGNEIIVRNNRFMDNDTGAACQQYSSPLFEKNELSGNKEGLVCFRASSPTVRNNEFYKNKKAILCVQICTPNITANNVHDNEKGVYLDLSSYALINGNNIWGNKVEMELGNMSSDWEYRVKQKPDRGRQAQNFNMASKGRAVAQKMDDGAKIMGWVDATGNWWGADVTQEMDKAGPQANIKSFIDGYDVPTRTYEGYSGVYLQDRIKYDGWKKNKIKNAGIN